MDITDHPHLGSINSQRTFTELFHDTEITEKSSVKSLFEGVDDTYLRKDIAKLSSFWNRNYRSPWGLASSNWVHDTVYKVRVYKSSPT